MGVNTNCCFATAFIFFIPLRMEDMPSLTFQSYLPTPRFTTPAFSLSNCPHSFIDPILLCSLSLVSPWFYPFREIPRPHPPYKLLLVFFLLLMKDLRHKMLSLFLFPQMGPDLLNVSNIRCFCFHLSLRFVSS